jgi:glycosyltransferase involved in cell wall biosynthesis
VILFVGPLPPPVHGFSLINAAMLARFQAQAESVVTFNRVPIAGALRIVGLIRGVSMFGRFAEKLLQSPAASTLYIGLSGGWGQLKDLPYILAALLLRRRILVHHHSFAYLRQSALHARWVLSCLRGSQHIALCECMAQALSDRYRIPRAQIEILSNAAFVDQAYTPATVAEQVAQRAPGGPLRLGFLSNITADKGIWAFLELVDQLSSQGLAVIAQIAGPVASDIQIQFKAEVALRPSCRHIGAVYDEKKVAFFASIDVLVFPTFYANEAEPVTIIEALACGVPVVANARGCITDLLPAAAGVVFSNDSLFVTSAATCLQRWANEPAGFWLNRRLGALSVFAELQAEHASRVTRIVEGALGHVSATGLVSGGGAK